jgi:hypothetical protein
MEKTLTVPEEVMRAWDEVIDNGIEFLDGYLGEEWVREIDLEELDINDTSKCVCGQLFDPETGRQAVTEGHTDGYSWAVSNVIEHGVPADYGFNLFDDECFSVEETDEFDLVAGANPKYEISSFTMFDLFTARWAERIEKRKAELGLMT